MFKRIRRRSAKAIASQYDSYADFARSAPNSDKAVVIEKAINEANKIQRRVAAQAK